MLAADWARPASWRQLLGLETWGIVLGRRSPTPCGYFITDWFAIYLVSKGYKLENTLLGFWVPIHCGGPGNFFGGGLSGWLIRPAGRCCGHASRTRHT